MTETNKTYTPWGWTRDVVELAEGVWRVTTPSHGGLKLSWERWDSLPAVVRDALKTPPFAEEDCEEPIVRSLRGIGDEGDRETAPASSAGQGLKVAGRFDRYAAALPYLLNRRVYVRVSGRHIAEGFRNRVSTCPIEVALVDAIPGIKDVEVECSGIRWRDKLGRPHAVEPPPPAVGRWIEAFDYAIETVKPFEFELELATPIRWEGR